jgi:hypothetical protein
MRYSPRAAFRPTLFPPANPRFAPVSMRVASGNASRTIAGLPSAEPLSTTRTSIGREGGFARTEPRQARRRSRVL